METYEGVGLGTRWSEGVSFTLWPLYPRENSPHLSLQRRPDEPQGHAEYFGGEKKKNLLPVVVIKPRFLSRPARKTVEVKLSLESIN
jgi:hypothetical protein